MTRFPCVLAYQPSTPELRMIGAMVQQSICDALQHGEDRASFRGYRIEARRIDAVDGGNPFVTLTLSAEGGTGALDRLFMAVASRPKSGSACGICFSGAPAIASRCTESLVGCVSPFDARYASPESGQIS